MRYILISVMMIYPLFADYTANISHIPPHIKHKMLKGNSYHRGCPVGFEDLRYITLIYKNFKGKDKQGELIVHKDIAQSVVNIFKELYDIHYPIKQMSLVSDFGGNDWRSIEADNTSAFNCRNATGTNHFSKHAYGKAIDINPIENPYISKTGHISHKASLKFRKRVHKNNTPQDKALIKKGDKALQIFEKYHFKWGGEWRYVKDYQHFEHR